MPPEAAGLERRLIAAGLHGLRGVEVHANRSVMVSVTRRGTLRVHRAYADAPDDVLRAIVDFVRPRVPRLRRVEARRRLLSFPVDHGPRPPRIPPLGTRDLAAVQRLEREHARLNAAFFHPPLATIPIRLSRRMRTRLGELLLEDGTGRAACIVISERHLRRDGWDEVTETLLHEMVHQWQTETGRRADHGPAFRRKARAVGIEPRAGRAPERHPRAARDSGR
jgi:hypothetical protein